MDIINDFSLDSVDFGFDTSEFALSQPDTIAEEERRWSQVLYLNLELVIQTK